MALDYFTLEELRAEPDVASTERYPDDRVTAAGEYVQGIIEGACQTSFVAREVTETLDGTGATRLMLSTPFVLAVNSVTIDGVACTDEFTVSHGVLERRTVGTFTPLVWTRGRRNIVVNYDAGYSATPPADIKGAALQATRARLLATSDYSVINDRQTSLTTELGTIGFVVAGEDRPTGYPEVDAVINRWAKKLNTVTFP